MMAVEPSLSFDDILNAVKESRRGRWFLDEYQDRLRQNETSGILAAITKLEGAISGMGHIGADAAALARAKSAIAQARRDITNLDAKPQELSEEGQLFARLADMARKSLVEDRKCETPLALTSGIVRALRLVDELDHDLSGATPRLPAAASTRYFHQDADIFEKPSYSAKPESAIPGAGQSTAKYQPAEVEPPKGAKLVIRHVTSNTSNPVVTRTETPAEPALPLETTAMDPPVANISNGDDTSDTTAEKPRIVIIRRKPEEMMDVPLVDQAETVSAA